MKNAFIVFALLSIHLARSQHLVHEVEYDDFTGETIMRIQDQRKDSAYSHLDAQSHLFSEFLNWRVQLKSIAKPKSERILVIRLWAPNDDTYGGLDDADIIFKFLDGSTLKTKVGHYEFDTKSLSFLDEDYTIYTLWCIIPLVPHAFLDDGIDQNGILFDALSTKKLEAVRMYFGKGYVNFEVDDATIFIKLLARY